MQVQRHLHHPHHHPGLGSSLWDTVQKPAGRLYVCSGPVWGQTSGVCRCAAGACEPETLHTLLIKEWAVSSTILSVCWCSVFGKVKLHFMVHYKHFAAPQTPDPLFSLLQMFVMVQTSFMCRNCFSPCHRFFFVISQENSDLWQTNKKLTKIVRASIFITFIYFHSGPTQLHCW